MKKFFDALSGRYGACQAGLTLVEAIVTLLVICVALVGAGALAMADTGSVAGTGTDITVNVGFTPSHVRVVNVNTGDAMEWFSGMGDDSAVKLTNATDGTSRAVIASEGITPYAGTINATTGTVLNSPGFIIGADTDINVVSNSIFYEVDR